MNGYHVKKPRVMIARIETKMYTQNYHEILKSFDNKLYWGHMGVQNTRKRFSGCMSGRMNDVDLDENGRLHSQKQEWVQVQKGVD